MISSFKYRVYPTDIQCGYMAKQFGCCRFIYNHFLKLCSDDTTIKPNMRLLGLLPDLRKSPDTAFLKEVSSVALQQSLLNMVSAYRNFFEGRSRYPKFKKKMGRQGFKLVGNSYAIKDNRLYIAKMPGSLKVKFSRPLPSEPTSVVITMTPSGEFYASFVCEVPNIKVPSSKSTGIDLGLKEFCITSEGVKYDNPRYFIKSEKRIARLQRRLARKQKGSKNRNKARVNLASLYQHITNQRNDFLHKLSTKLIHENQVICLEDLNASGMMRNRRLAKHIADVSWNRFCSYLTYKAVRYERQLMVINTFTPSTQTCSACHVQSEIKLTLDVRNWVCNHCGAQHDRDINAARVIHTVGMLHWYSVRDNLSTLMLVPRWKNGKFLL